MTLYHTLPGSFSI